MFSKHKNGMILYLVHLLISPGLHQMGRWKCDYEVCGDGPISVMHASPGDSCVCYVHEFTLCSSVEVLGEAILYHKRSRRGKGLSFNTITISGSPCFITIKQKDVNIFPSRLRSLMLKYCIVCVQSKIR